ncbi:MAG: alpha/beta hydrolase [Planctomycetota bacterium]|jgi:pimeloyl-ACP methyl ester carboxylesterase|nr:alpha/beta hydrolase [Planctomycetota bacterium]
MIVDSVEIRTHDEGVGEAVLFLHGWGSEFAVFKPFLDSLAGHYRAVALDMPGFGGSEPPPSAWDVDGYADFILKFLAEKEIRKAIVIGHSFGGRVAIKLAARAGSPTAQLEIPKMILVDAAGIKPKKSPMAKAKQFVYKAVRSVLSVKLVERMFPDALERWRRSHASADYCNATPLMRQVLVKTVNEDLTPCLSRIPCPTLLVWGANDTATPIADAKIMEERIPDSGLVVLPGAGHYSFLDQPYAFGRVLDSFLNIER